MVNKFKWWWCNQWIHPLRHHFSLYLLWAGMPWLVGHRHAVSLPWGVSVDELTVGLSRPMVCLQGDCSQGWFLPLWWWYILMVWVWCQSSDAYIERLVVLQLWCMLPLSVHFYGRVYMQHRGLFFLSGCVFKAIWCAWLKSCGVSWGWRIHKNMVEGIPLVLGFSRIVLKVLGNISRRLRVF